MANRKYTLPPELSAKDVEQQVVALRGRAGRRRAALVAAGCGTYEIGRRGEQIAIVCMCCGLGSNNLDDVEKQYCGFCKEFHAEDEHADDQG